MVQDVGRAINPLTVRGQVIGSLVQGLGGAVLEDLKYDAQGQFLTGSLADYLLPTASDFPNLRCFVTDDHPSPINPLGAKGAGEGGIVAAGGCMANAVANALQSFGVAAARICRSRRRYIWELVQDAPQRARGVRCDPPSVLRGRVGAPRDDRTWTSGRFKNRFDPTPQLQEQSHVRRPPSAPERA